MKVILKEDVDNLGPIGAIVDVAKGYGRNYLIPRSLAVEATKNNMKQFEHEKSIILAKAKKIKKSAEDRAEDLAKLTISTEVKAGKEGKLFGSVTTKDIAEMIGKQGIEVDRRKIVLAEPIKRLGTYEVPIKIHHEVTATVQLEVKSDGTEVVEPEEKKTETDGTEEAAPEETAEEETKPEEQKPEE
jgi:large subunit ribosomal protein L9